MKGIEITDMLVIESQKQPEDLDIITTCKLFLAEHDTKDSLF